MKVFLQNESTYELFLIKGVNGSDRPELTWPSNSGALTSPVTPGGPLVPGGYPPSALAYPSSVSLQTPPPTLLPPTSSTPASVASGINSTAANFNLSLSVNPRLLGTAHMPHPLTSLINSLHGLNKLPSTGGLPFNGGSPTIQHHQHPDATNNKNGSRLTVEVERPKSPKLSVSNVSKSAFHHVTPSLTSLEESSKSGASSPSSTSNSPTVVLTTTNSNNTTPIKSAGNQTKTVWRPYWVY